MSEPTTPLTPADLAAMRARAEAATEGPWKQCGGSIIPPDELQGHFEHDPPDWIEWRSPEYPRWLADAEFIAHARDDLPRLLDEVERLRGVVRGLRAEQSLNRWYDANEAQLDAGHEPLDRSIWTEQDDAATERMVEGGGENEQQSRPCMARLD